MKKKPPPPTDPPPTLSAPPPTKPANDTSAPSSLPVGRTFDNGTWRMHRFTDSIRVVHLVNAGKPGKRCTEITIVARYGQDLDLFELLSSHLVGVVADNPSAEALSALAKDAPLMSSAFETTVAELRGVEVEIGFVRVTSDLVQAYFSPIEFRVTVTALVQTEKGTVRQDSHLYNADRRSAAKAYRWAKAHEDSIGTMTRSEIYTALRDAGVRVNLWG